MVYMGAKSKYAGHIVPVLQQTIDENNVSTYIECFVGGANIIDKIKCDILYFASGSGNDFLHDLGANVDDAPIRVNDYLVNLPTVEVDVQTVGARVDRIGLRAEGIEHALRDHPRASVRTVETDAEVAEGVARERDEITDVTITPLYIVNGSADGIFRGVRRNARFTI